MNAIKAWCFIGFEFLDGHQNVAFCEYALSFEWFGVDGSWYDWKDWRSWEKGFGKNFGFGHVAGGHSFCMGEVINVF